MTYIFFLLVIEIVNIIFKTLYFKTHSTIDTHMLLFLLTALSNKTYAQYSETYCNTSNTSNTLRRTTIAPRTQNTGDVMQTDAAPLLGLALALTRDAKPSALTAPHPSPEIVASLIQRTGLPEIDVARRLAIKVQHLRRWARGEKPRYYNLWALQMLAAQGELGYLDAPPSSPWQTVRDAHVPPLILQDDPHRFELVLNLRIDLGLDPIDHPQHNGSLELWRQHIDDLTADPAGHTAHLSAAGLVRPGQAPGPCMTLRQLAAVAGAGESSLRAWAKTPAAGSSGSISTPGSCAAPRALQLLLMLLSRMRLFGLLGAVTGPAGSTRTPVRAARMRAVDRTPPEQRTPAPGNRPRVDARQDHVAMPAYYAALMDLIGAPVEHVALCLGVTPASVYNWLAPSDKTAPRYANQVALETLAVATLIEKADITHADAWRRVVLARDKALEAAAMAAPAPATTEPTAGEDPDVLAIAQALQQARAGLDLI